MPDLENADIKTLKEAREGIEKYLREIKGTSYERSLEYEETLNLKGRLDVQIAEQIAELKPTKLSCVKAILSFVEINDIYMDDKHLCTSHKEKNACGRLEAEKKSIGETRAAIGEKCE